VRRTPIQDPDEKKEFAKLNPKEVLCAEYSPTQLIEISVRIRNMLEAFTTVIRTLHERKVRFCSGFHTVSRKDDNSLIDVSHSDVLKLILTERSAKSWCLAEAAEFGNSRATPMLKSCSSACLSKGNGRSLQPIFQGLLSRDIRKDF
jgi:hypothetical protein